MDISTLKNITLFGDLNDEDLNKILKLCKIKHYHTHNIILFEEDLGDMLFFIIKGKVQISRTNEAGKEIILSIIKENDYFGEMSILDGKTRSANAVALSDASVFIINKKDFYFILEEYPKVAIRLLKNLTSRLRKADQLIASLSLNNAENKICNTILSIAEDSGINKNGSVIINKMPSQQIIANMSGTSRETVSRMLSKLKTKKLINTKNHKLVINSYEDFLNKLATS